jgi:hypothetical protein
VGRPREPQAEGETRVLRYLPTHLSATEIAGELHLSANTVRTHLRTCTRSLARTAAARLWSVPAPSACSRPRPIRQTASTHGKA